MLDRCLKTEIPEAAGLIKFFPELDERISGGVPMLMAAIELEMRKCVAGIVLHM